MTKLKDLSIVQLQRIIKIKEQIEALQNQLDSIEGGKASTPAGAEAPRKYRMSAGRRRKLLKTLAKARKMRWAKNKGKGEDAKAAKPAKKSKMSAATKAKISAATKARWAKAKGAGKKGL